MEISFQAMYPFKPPKITSTINIFHLNIDEKGQICLPAISAENWKPSLRGDPLIQPEHLFQADPAEECTKCYETSEIAEFRFISGKMTCGLKSADDDFSKCEQRPQELYSDIPKAELWKFDVCHFLSLTFSSHFPEFSLFRSSLCNP